MSVKVMAYVWDLELQPNKKFILLAYADHANDNGESIFPSNETVAKKTGTSVRTVQRLKKELVEHFNLGINTIDFKPLEKDLIFAKSLGIFPDDTVVVFIGTIYPFAGLLQLISNFSKIEKQISYFKLLIVGGGPSFKKLEAKVREN